MGRRGIHGIVHHFILTHHILGQPMTPADIVILDSPLTRLPPYPGRVIRRELAMSDVKSLSSARAQA